MARHRHGNGHRVAMMDAKDEQIYFARIVTALLILAAMAGYGTTKMPGFITIACALAGFFMSI